MKPLVPARPACGRIVPNTICQHTMEDRFGSRGCTFLSIGEMDGKRFCAYHSDAAKQDRKEIDRAAMQKIHEIARLNRSMQLAIGCEVADRDQPLDDVQFAFLERAMHMSNGTLRATPINGEVIAVGDLLFRGLVAPVDGTTQFAISNRGIRAFRYAEDNRTAGAK